MFVSVLVVMGILAFAAIVGSAAGRAEPRRSFGSGARWGSDSGSSWGWGGDGGSGWGGGGSCGDSGGGGGGGDGGGCS
ncbi:hypothetical protein SAMN04488550_3607 [Gordonia malaquae]|uniref:Uncharacterized protein n=1 Tax=Gordonia malaquae NBRC 108250 TaxID=1223542 RepID=M3VD80_GORML|nr:hypothetical protein [Gordonia malaquae]GAC78224.1 hypothetical protein GM1_002_02020 [Gordonia malaquae NBRC 108250]SED98620.1 hypothetical protein SAMN04488550_3607 [Gordonia malaquae]